MNQRNIVGWAVAGFVAGTLVVDPPGYASSTANVIAFKLVGGITCAAIAAVIGLVVAKFSGKAPDDSRQ